MGYDSGRIIKFTYNPTATTAGSCTFVSDFPAHTAKVVKILAIPTPNTPTHIVSLDENGGVITTNYSTGAQWCSNTIKSYNGGTQTIISAVYHSQMTLVLIATGDQLVIEYLNATCEFRRAYYFPTAILAIDDILTT